MPSEKGRNPETRAGKPFRATADLSEGWDTQSYRDIFFDFLKKKGPIEQMRFILDGWPGS